MGTYILSAFVAIISQEWMEFMLLHLKTQSEAGK